MTSPLEQCARAIGDELGKREMLMADPETLSRLLSTRCARACLQALLDNVSEEMAEAGAKDMPVIVRHESDEIAAISVFTAMIRHAMGEQ